MAESDADTTTPEKEKKSERAAFFIHLKVSHLCQRGKKIPGQQVQARAAQLQPLAD